MGRTEILNFIKQKGETSPKDIAQHFSISTQSVHKHLRHLTQTRAVEKHGSAPKTFYVYSSDNNLEANRSALNNFLRESKPLFWDIPVDHLGKLSNQAIVERIINMGNSKEIQFILDYYKEDLQLIYKGLASKARPNLDPQSLSFLKNYIRFNNVSKRFR